MAEDVAQDVFIKCYEKMDTFRNESSYKTWLIRITVNRSKYILKSWSFKNLYFTDFFKAKQANSSLEYRFFGGQENDFKDKDWTILSIPKNGSKEFNKKVSAKKV